MMSVYITSISGHGNVVTSFNSSILNKKPTHEPTQRWTIERKDGAKNQVAFRCDANGQYLRAKTGAPYGPVELGAKQWWQLEDGQAYGSYWIKSTDFPDAYLCNANGSTVENNKIYMWPKQDVWKHALTFYLQDADAPGYLSQAEQKDGGSSAAEAEKLLQDVKKREQAVAEKEAEAAKATKLSEEAKQMMEEARKKEATLAEKEAKLAKAAQSAGSADGRAKELDEKEKQLTAREKDYQARFKELDEREKKARLTGSASGTDNVDAKARSKELATLEKERKEVAKKFAELEAREQQLSAKERQLSSKGKLNGSAGGTAAATSAPAADDSALAEENKRLAAELAELKKEMANASKDGGLVHRTGGRTVPPPTNILPERKRPEAKKPGQSIPSTYNPDLLKRFEAGRIAMKGEANLVTT